MDGHTVRLACAETNRARQTAEHIRRGLLDGMQLFGREATVGDIVGYREFQNFAVSTPEGLRDVTSAFRLYAKEIEAYERVSMGERPGWLVEIDRFWKIQNGGGDPITHWLRCRSCTSSRRSRASVASGPVCCASTARRRATPSSSRPTPVPSVPSPPGRWATTRVSRSTPSSCASA
jgi:hypothetical protein